jgi:hypothetical protein
MIYMTQTTRRIHMITIHKRHLLPRYDPEEFYLACADHIFNVANDLIPDAKVRVSMYDTEKAKALNEGALIKMGGAFCEITVKPTSKYIQSHIHIAKHIEDILDRWSFITLEQRSGSYFDSLNVPWTPERLFAFTLLHELGHVYHFCRFRSANMLAVMDGMYMNARGLRDLLHPSYVNKWMTETNLSLIQFVDVLEAHCDIFAMHQFPALWHAVEGTVRGD